MQHKERGVAVIEFALVLTLLAPLIVVIIAWGVRFHNAAQADNAAFIAARYYAIKCSSEPGSAMADAKAAGAASTSLVSAADITVSGSCTVGGTITARVSKNQAWSPTVPFFGMSGTYPLGGTGAARCEG